MLIIARTTMHDREEVWKEMNKKGPRQRVIGDFVTQPPGLGKKTKHSHDKIRNMGFKVLEVDEQDDDEEPEVLDIRCVECEPRDRWIEKSVTDQTKNEKSVTDQTKTKKSVTDRTKNGKTVTDERKIKKVITKASEKTREETKIRAVENSNADKTRPASSPKKWAS